MPQVKALRAALGIRCVAGPVALLDPRAEVRVAALGALEFRKEWRPGQAEVVLQVGQRAENPASAPRRSTPWATSTSGKLSFETLAQFMLDTSLEVRKAAVEALMWDCEHRWNWIRYTVRRVMADPIFMNDGPLLPDGQTLSDEAVSDLTAWCAEKGCCPLALPRRWRPTTIARSPSRTTAPLYDAPRPLLVNHHTPAILRLELGRLLQMFKELDPQLLESLLDQANSAPLRLIACESILNSANSTESSLHPRAINTLKDLARLPNREIALAAADVVQRRLGVDLGMGIGQPLPAVHSRQAADITRRVMQWAIQFNDDENLEDSRPNRNRVLR